MRYFIVFCIWILFVPWTWSQNSAPVEKTGQFLSHAIGDDGDLQTGVPWPVPRFTDHGDGTVTDNLTGLMWIQQVNAIGNLYPSFDVDDTPGDGNVYWTRALDFVFGINDGIFPCGMTTVYSDWRLPNVRELCSVIDFGRNMPALCDAQGTGEWTPGDPFFGVEFSDYWTSTTNANQTNGAWFVDLTTGYTNAVNKASVTKLVWAVRSANEFAPFFPKWPWSKDIRDFVLTANGRSAFPAPVEQTGQTDSFGVFDDGFHQAGVPLPQPRFSEGGDNTITDHLTGLMWMRYANPISDLHPIVDDDEIAGDGLVFWQTALDFAAEVNAGIYSCGVTTPYSDWRLPNIGELTSLIHYGYANPSLSSMYGSTYWTQADPFFGLASDPAYWSSTSGATGGTSTMAWVTMFNFGPILRLDKTTSTCHVWLVRGP